MATAHNNIANSTRRPKDVNYFHISSVKRSINSCRVCSASIQSIGQNNVKCCFTDCIAICGATDKTCVLVPLPANQLRDNITSIVSAITMVINASLDEAAA